MKAFCAVVLSAVLTLGRVGVSNLAMAQATPAPSAAPDAMAQARAYFMQHSFDFPTVFRAHHPGPAWILQHASDFNLTPEQTTKMEQLRGEMRSHVTEGSAKLKEAYAHYEADAHEAMPEEKTMLQDVRSVGDAQIQLAGTMIPYHLQSYALLDSTQKKTYDRLVAAGP